MKILLKKIALFNLNHHLVDVSPSFDYETSCWAEDVIETETEKYLFEELLDAGLVFYQNYPLAKAALIGLTNEGFKLFKKLYKD